GLQVIGIGESKTPESLRKVCNRFVLIENIVSGNDPAPEPKPGKPAETAQPAQATKEAPSKAIPLIRDAMKKIDPDQDDYSLGQLGQVITQLHPDFDPRTYGSAKLSDLLRKTGRFDVFPGLNNSLKVRDKA
ncbi:MAG: OST-HTH/LOTUS domain-containing protein, partial [Paracoccaceae bacterium]